MCHHHHHNLNNNINNINHNNPQQHGELPSGLQVQQRQFLRAGKILGNFKLDVATVMSQQGTGKNCVTTNNNTFYYICGKRTFLLLHLCIADTNRPMPPIFPSTTTTTTTFASVHTCCKSTCMAASRDPSVCVCNTGHDKSLDPFFALRKTRECADAQKKTLKRPVLHAYTRLVVGSPKKRLDRFLSLSKVTIRVSHCPHSNNIKCHIF